MRDLSRRDRAAMFALENALEHDRAHRIDAADRIRQVSLLAPPRVSARRAWDMPAVPGSVDETGFSTGIC